MEGLDAWLTDLGVVFTLVLARTGALVTTAPLLSDPSMPVRVRALMAVGMAGVFTPMCLDYPSPAVENLFDLGAMVIGEAVIGIALGLGVLVVLTGVQLTGQVVGQMSGMALAEGTDPILQSNSTVFGQMFYFVTVAVFVAAGGHRLMIEGLLDTFDQAPPGFAQIAPSLVHEFLGLVSLGFELGLRVAAPLMVALFLATVVLGLISRTLPQINVIVVGFGVNSMLTLGVMMATVGSVAWAFQEPIVASVEGLVAAVEPVEILE